MQAGLIFTNKYKKFCEYQPSLHFISLVEKVTLKLLPIFLNVVVPFYQLSLFIESSISNFIFFVESLITPLNINIGE